MCIARGRKEVTTANSGKETSIKCIQDYKVAHHTVSTQVVKAFVQ